MSLFSSEMEITIPFFDVDPMNIVWHGNYIKYLEQARCDMFTKLNYTYIDMSKDFYAYPIAKMNTKYIKPISFNDVIIIKSELLTIEPALNIKYTMYNKKDNEKIFTAETMQIAVDIRTKESIYNAPDKLKKILENINEKQIL
ncbi:acyl-CoA thioesterase [bacterium]|nr:acyl-CoA thioesterase [bacterium]